MTVENTTDFVPAEVVEGSSGELAISGGQTGFTPGQVAVLRQIGVEDAAPEDLDLFFHICRRSGLDPFARQIYMIGRDTSVKVRVDVGNGNSRVEERRVTKFTIQTGIDGYRLIGSRTARAAGALVSHDGPQWCGKDGVWQDFWPKTNGSPVAARYVIRVDGAPFSAICMFEEFAQYSGRGELTSMWKKMPANQLAKCAEAAAWRKAFPADFSGILLEGTDQQTQVIDTEGAPVRVPSSQARGSAGLRNALGMAAREPEPAGGDGADQERQPGRTEGSLWTPANRRKWVNRMFALLGEADCSERDDQLLVIAGLAGVDAAGMEHRDDLTDEQLRAVVTGLNEKQKAGELGGFVTEVLNQAALREAEAQQ